MSTNFIQPSFSAGELSPTLFARVDFAKYHVGLAKCRNFFVDYRGGVSTRPGTKFIVRAKYDSLPVRLIQFQFSTVQGLALLFGDHYMWAIQDGAVILNTAKSIVNLNSANPGLFTVPLHGYANGTWVFLSSVNGMPRLKNFFGIVINATANTFQLTNTNGVPLNTIDLGTYTGGGTVASIFELATPYAASDLAALKFTQSADVMTLTHPSYPPYDLARLGATNWTITAITIGATITAPTGLIATATGAGNAAYAYVVTAVNASGDESVASARADVVSSVDIGATAGSIAIGWDPVVGAVAYNIYKAVPVSVGSIPVGVNFGFIGESTSTAFVDGNITADFTLTPPVHNNPLAGNNPRTVAYFQQRKGFFSSASSLETFWFSKTGQYYNFDTSSPVQPNDAIEGTLVSQQINAIQSVVGMPGGLVILTTGGAWQISGGASNAPITPATVTATPQAYNGASALQPLTINYDILYVQNRGSNVRDLSYNFYTNIYTGTDISILSNHLFQGYTIPEWAYAEEPYKLIWAVRSDGHMLSCTYIKEQELIGWAQHDTLGLFKSICAIQEGIENFVYTVVQRTIGNVQCQYVERFASRLMPYGAEDAWCLDSALTNDLTYPAGSINVSAVTGAVTITCAAPSFSPSNVGSTLRVDKGVIKITEYVNQFLLHGTVIKELTVTLPNSSPTVPLYANSGEWSLTAPFTTFLGLDHLEGQVVSILGDGNVFSNQVVINGSITINQPVSKIIIGLAYLPQGQTLALDIGEPTIQGKRKKITAANMRVVDTRGLSVGPTFNELIEFKMRDGQPMGTPIELETGDQRVNIMPAWDEQGRICFQQNYPLPATVAGMIYEYVVGDK